MGKPRKYNSVEDLQKNIDDYFEFIQGEYEEVEKHVTHKDGSTEIKMVKNWLRDAEPPTHSGLALHLGFASRQSLYDYMEHDTYSYPIKRAILFIEKYNEIQVSKGTECAGNIFLLKNMGWKDKQEIDTTIKQVGGLEILE